MGILASQTAAAVSDRSLITVFLSGPQTEQRRGEDRLAAQRLGCSYRCLELPDAPDRPEVHDGLDRFMPYGPPHLGIANEIVHRLLPRLTTPATLYAPLAVGAHIDHRIVHEAARALAYQVGPTLRLVFYEDLPYALADYAVARRLAALGHAGPPALSRGSPSAEVAAYRRWLLSMPLLAERLPGLRTLMAHRIGQVAVRSDLQPQQDRPGFAPRLRPTLCRIPDASAAWSAAIAPYTSQWPQFAGSAAALAERFARYGQAVAAQHGQTGQVVQRLWIDAGAYGP